MMGFFGPKKTPEEKQKEMEELKRQIDDLEQKKHPKKVVKAPQTDQQEKAGSSGLSVVNVTKLREDRQNRKKQSRDEFAKKIANHKINEIRERQRQKESISRLSKDNIKDLVDLINISDDIFDFYQRGTRLFDDEVFVSLGLLSKAEVTLFDYLVSNDLSSELYQGEVSLLNQAYIQSQKEKFDKFAQSNEQMMKSIQSGKTQFYDDRLSNLPHIYVFGNEQDYRLVKAMSIPAVVHHVFNFDDLEVFEYDQDKKCVVLFKTVNGELSSEYQRIKNSQDFKILLAFNASPDVHMNNEVVPFNREKLINKLI